MTAKRTKRWPKLHVADGYELCLDPHSGAAMVRINGTSMTHSFDEAIEFGIVQLIYSAHKTPKTVNARRR